MYKKGADDGLIQRGSINNKERKLFMSSPWIRLSRRYGSFATEGKASMPLPDDGHQARNASRVLQSNRLLWVGYVRAGSRRSVVYLREAEHSADTRTELKDSRLL
jgi:hypothetical protein